ncbi:hypothetical protein QTJ16_005945 [Diplocarpon rosae]|uniref:SGNH hydrolase-type esterase domain-containing protein n=1 Tax=Diplocarpon rosae TaxID=946125 RepID=A0AAD9WAY9_9HELO|nr:hypothetical protein QTJ16_005945 [Diplocarpon rosae]
MLFISLLCSVSILSFTAFASPTEFRAIPVVEKRSSDVQTLESRLQARSGVDLSIITIGASIAKGYGSTDGNGFRSGVKSILTSAGNRVTMVGTQRSGTMPNNDHEAYEGLRIDEVTAKVKANLATLKPSPNIAIIHLGSNDISQNYATSTMHQRLSSLLDYICQTLPNARIVVSTLLPHTKIEDGALKYNANLRAVVNSQRQRGRHVYLADVHTPELTPGDMHDTIHPNNNGYAKMARIYAKAIQDALRDPPATVPVTRNTPSSPLPVLEDPYKTTNLTSNSTTSTPIPLQGIVQGGADSMYHQSKSGSVTGSIIQQLFLILGCAVLLLA